MPNHWLSFTALFFLADDIYQLDIVGNIFWHHLRNPTPEENSVRAECLHCV